MLRTIKCVSSCDVTKLFRPPTLSGVADRCPRQGQRVVTHPLNKLQKTRRMINVASVLSLFTNSWKALLSGEHGPVPQTSVCEQLLVTGHVVQIHASHLPFLYLPL